MWSRSPAIGIRLLLPVCCQPLTLLVFHVRALAVLVDPVEGRFAFQRIEGIACALAFLRGLPGPLLFFLLPLLFLEAVLVRVLQLFLPAAAWP